MTQSADANVYTPLPGYRFNNPALLQQALTHPSALSKNHTMHYERLEFLGDAILGFLVSELLYAEFPKEKEGDLAKRKAALVCGAVLAEIARDIGLDQHLILGEGEEKSGGRSNAALLENAMEAVLAALYLDAGSIEPVRSFVQQHFHARAKQELKPPTSAKNALQEWAQAHKMGLPTYRVAEEDGPAHAPHFVVEVSLQDGAKASATAGNKKEAERKAAKALLEKLEHTEAK